MVRSICIRAVMLCTTAISYGQTLYNWQPIGCYYGTPYGPAATVYGLGNDGRVVGEYNSWRVFVWKNGVFTDITPNQSNVLGGAGKAINDTGLVAADLFLPSVYARSSVFVLESGRPDRVVTPVVERFSQSFGINNAGVVLGLSDNTAWIAEAGVVTNVGSLSGRITQPSAINDSKQVVGSSRIAGDLSNIDHAFLWQSGTINDLGTLPGGQTSRANDINNPGQVVGYSQAAGGATHCFLWQKGTMTDISPDSKLCTAQSINDLGAVAGQFAPAGVTGNRAFVREGTALVDLNSRLVSPLPNEQVLDLALQINNYGQILAQGYAPAIRCNFLLSPTGIVR